MTNPNYTHITMLADRSGSMDLVRADAEGAINAFIDAQKKVDGKATLHFYDFDCPKFTLARRQWNGNNQLLGQIGNVNYYPEFVQPSNPDWFQHVYRGDLQHAPVYRLHPRGGTALLDATEKAINLTGDYLRTLNFDDRPGKVIFVVQTDGGENNGRPVASWEGVNNSVDHQRNKYGWEFVFLGMGLDVAAQGTRLGFNNIVTAAGSGASYGGTYSLASTRVASYRVAAGGQSLALNATVAEDGTVEEL